MEKPTPIDQEFPVEGRKIVSETDSRGIITYANRKFCEISGYSVNELVGQNHNIVRHPDMPKAAFKQVWRDIQSGKEWHGYIKNLRKDGQYYWVETHISPHRDENGNTTGYIAVRGEVNRKELEAIKTEYENLLQEETN